MDDHIERMKYILWDAVPHKNTEAFKKIKSAIDKRCETDPNFDKETKKLFEIAHYSLSAQDASHPELLTSHIIRHFLREFNLRTWQYGLRTLPLMFNVLEAFFKYQKPLVYFELLEEEDYIISLYDYLNFTTSKDFKGNPSLISDYLEDNIIYHFNVGCDLDNIKFVTSSGENFVIGGISLVKRGKEAVVLLTTGLLFDKVNIKVNITKDFYCPPGKEDIEFDKDKTLEPVLLNNNPKYWQTLVACRFDLDSMTLDIRYVAKEFQNVFEITSDEIGAHLNSKGEFIDKSVEESYKTQIRNIEEYNSLFEVAKTALYLPYYINHFDERIIIEDHVTKYKELIKNPLEKRKYRKVPDRLKHIYKEVFILNLQNKFAPDRLVIRDDLFRIETSGYWKEINPDEIGTDKKGNQISGKTWVCKTLSWFEVKNDEINVSKSSQKIFNTPNEGFIYIMKNPVMDENVFKIRLTRKDTDLRKKQLSNTSVPDKFYKMNEWIVKDCILAEKEIHLLLHDFRVDPRREFFKIEYDKACKAITQVVDKINNQK